MQRGLLRLPGKFFDQLLGGSLTKTVPLAAYCYPDWSEYGADKCSEVVSDWFDAYLQ